MDSGLGRLSISGGGSVYPFAHNVLLAARDAGFGGVITTVLVRQEPAVKELLGIPAEHALACTIPLGKPRRQVTRLRRNRVEDFTTARRSAVRPMPNRDAAAGTGRSMTARRSFGAGERDRGFAPTSADSVALPLRHSQSTTRGSTPQGEESGPGCSNAPPIRNCSEETTRRFLGSNCPLTKIRDLAGTKSGYEPDFWRRGARAGLDVARRTRRRRRRQRQRERGPRPGSGRLRVRPARRTRAARPHQRGRGRARDVGVVTTSSRARSPACSPASRWRRGPTAEPPPNDRFGRVTRGGPDGRRLGRAVGHQDAGGGRRRGRQLLVTARQAAGLEPVPRSS